MYNNLCTIIWPFHVQYYWRPPLMVRFLREIILGFLRGFQHNKSKCKLMALCGKLFIIKMCALYIIFTTINCRIWSFPNMF